MGIVPQSEKGRDLPGTHIHTRAHSKYGTLPLNNTEFPTGCLSLVAVLAMGTRVVCFFHNPKIHLAENGMHAEWNSMVILRAAKKCILFSSGSAA